MRGRPGEAGMAAAPGAKKQRTGAMARACMQAHRLHRASHPPSITGNPHHKIQSKECLIMPAYKILLMGASYGSLLASKLLFGGHSIHLVCLPAEADLINAEGFKVKLPIRGRKDPVLLESR
jgi:hypothetical protein